MFSRFVLSALCVAAPVVLAGCGGDASPSAASHVAAPATADLDALTPVSVHGDGATVVRAYVDPVCDTDVCTTFTTTALPALAAESGITLKIYDYPLSQSGEAFMLAAIGRCVEEKAPGSYLRFLADIAATEDIDDEIEMMRIARTITEGTYDSSCTRSAAEEIKPTFENGNPLNLDSTPAVVVGDALLYNPTADQVTTLTGK